MSETFNAIQEQLLKPFDDSVISDVDGFSYVDPYHYFMRWHEVFTDGFKFKVHSITSDDIGLRGQAYFYGAKDGCEWEIEVPCSETWQRASGGGAIQKWEQTDNKLTSAGCKNVSRVFGVGLHLYRKAATHGGSKKGGQSYSGAAAPASNGAAPDGWDGTQLVGFGKKYPNHQWKDADDGFVNWAIANSKDHGHFAQAEMNRRTSNNVAIGTAQAAKAAPPQATSPTAAPASNGARQIPF